MRRTNFVTKLISIILFVGLSAYFGVYVFNALRSPLTTAPAILLPGADGFSTTGIIVREEQAVTVGQTLVSSYVREGEKVSAGQAYLVGYSSQEERERDIRRGQLEQEISQLEEHLAVSSSLDHAAAVETEVKRRIEALNYATAGGALKDLEERIITLRALVFSGDLEQVAYRVERLRAELSELGTAGSGVNLIHAERSGVYSSVVDGFEDVSPDSVAGMDAAALRSLIQEERQGSEAAAGKLIFETTWYYAAVVPAQEAQKLEAIRSEGRGSVTVSFPGQDTAVEMRISALSPETDGEVAVLLSATTSLAETTALRQTDATVIYEEVEGIRVPKGAVYLEAADDETGVRPVYLYTLTAGTAEKKYVRILHEAADYYLVAPDTERTPAASGLREGNTIIVRGGDLYDGKVVS